MQPSNPSFGTKEGACGYGLIPKDQYPYFSVAALSPSNKFAKAGPLMGCGQCFQIQCQTDMDGKDVCIKDSQGKPKSVLVMISDTCPECEAEHIDVQSLSFAKLANPDIGRIKVTYRRVECAPPQDVQVSVMDFAGSNGWLRLVIQDTGGRGSVKSVSIKSSSSGSWVKMSNTWGATWELGSAPAPPLDFVVETENGDQVTATGVIRQNGGISLGKNGNSLLNFSTGKQFTINDPAVLQVKAFSGEQDPMLITSDTPGNGGSSNSSSGGSGAMSVNAGSADCASYKSDSSTNSGSSCSQSCTDVVPKGPTPCSQWKAWGKCSDDWIVKGQFCSATCGRCSTGASSSGATGSSSSSSSPLPSPKAGNSPSPSPKAASSPSPSPKAASSPPPSPKAASNPSPSPKAASSPPPSPKAASSPSPSPKAASSPAPSPKASNAPAPSPKPATSPSPSPKVASSPPQHNSGRRMLLLRD
ncbi:hypothetical protein N2152v2_006958 [Parachlorella kessleri]